MNCAWVKSQMTLYLYNELDDPERIEIEQHAGRCPECAAEIERERRLHRMLDDRGQPALEPNLLASCRLGLAEALERQPRARFAWSGVWGALVSLRPRFQPTFAALLLLAGFVAGWALASYRGRLPALPLISNGTEDFSVANITNIHAISPDERGNLEVVFDTTRRRVVRGSPQDPRIERLLVYAARSYANPGIRLDSIELLKDRAGEADIRAALISALRADQNPGVRLKALEALKDFSADAQVKLALLDALRQDDNPGVRIQAIDQLSKLRDASTVPLLQQLAAQDPNNYVRLRSASALRELNAPEIY